MQDLLEDSHAHGTDASGNPILKDVGMFMRSELKSAFKEADVKYIDPSYIIRYSWNCTTMCIFLRGCTTLMRWR